MLDHPKTVKHLRYLEHSDIRSYVLPYILE